MGEIIQLNEGEIKSELGELNKQKAISATIINHSEFDSFSVFSIHLDNPVRAE